MTAGSKEQLHELCAAAGQQHLLEDWDSLQTNEQEQLAEDIKVRHWSHIEFAISLLASWAQRLPLGMQQTKCVNNTLLVLQGLDFPFIKRALQASQEAAAAVHAQCQPVTDAVTLQVCGSAHRQRLSSPPEGQSMRNTMQLAHSPNAHDACWPWPLHRT
jgi:hypothetical protein